MAEVPCAFHPDRLTAVSCSNCGRPICPADMTPAPIGYQCPVCTGRAREGAGGAAAYRARSAVSARADRLPLVRIIRRAGVTQALIGINAAVFLVMLVTGRSNDLLRFGAMSTPLPRDQWWRLITAMFVHVNILHLLFNMWALTLFGPAIESRYGRFRYLILYLTAGFLGNALSLHYGPFPSVSAGASGAVFGILGAWIAFFVRHRNAQGARDQLRALFFLVGINLVIGYAGGGHIDNLAHIGGLIGGFLAATSLEQTGRKQGPAARAADLIGYAVVVALGLVLVLTSVRFATFPIFPRV